MHIACRKREAPFRRSKQIPLCLLWVPEIVLLTPFVWMGLQPPDYSLCHLICLQGSELIVVLRDLHCHLSHKYLHDQIE